MAELTNQKILEKAITKAIEGGWDPRHFNTYKANYKHPEDSEFHDLLGDWHGISPLDVIFNHDFAKALWGGKTHFYDIDPHINWQYHLQQMVVADDPIRYLGDNI